MQKPGDDPRVRELLLEAIEKPQGERMAFINKACLNAPHLRQEIESLLAALEKAGDFAPDPTLPLCDQSFPQGLATKIDRYTLLRRIGEGGFGSVFQARQEHPVKRQVAIKIIKLGMDTKQVIARFEAERQALAMMDHPHIARVFDAGATNAGRPYFVMELVEGLPITQYCDNERLNIAQRLELFVKVCQAVQHAHSKGIIHRDLKPSNILVSIVDKQAVPKIIDFGIAKAVQGRLTEQTMITQERQCLGTPQYMSPEQADGGQDVDTRSDIYMLGVLLYELLAGQTPFDDDDLARKSHGEIQRIIREVVPRAPSTRLKAQAALSAAADCRNTDAHKLRRTIKGELDWIVMKCLEKDSARRYETALGLADDIGRYLRHEPVAARQATRFYRLRKVVRRNRLAFASAAALLVALTAGLGVSTGLLMRAEKAEKAQIKLRQDSDARGYDSDMNLVQQALAVNNLRRARELLDHYRPRPGEADLRGWEWRYLWQQCQSDAVMELCAQPSAIDSLAVSHDGKYLAIGELESGGLSIWDLRTRKQLARIKAGEKAVMTAFSPDQTLLAYTSSTRDAAGRWHEHAQLWNPSGENFSATADLDDRCQYLGFSRYDKSLVAATARDGTKLTFWNVPTLTPNRTNVVPGSFDIRQNRFAISPDSSTVAAGSLGKSFCLIDLASGKEKWTPANAPTWPSSMAFSPDGRILAFSMDSNGTEIRLCDAATGKSLGSLQGHLAWVSALVFWPDGKTLASASADQTIRLWDISDPARHKAIGRPLRGHTHEVSRLALLPDGVTLVSGSKDGSVCLWDISTIRQDIGHTSFAASNYGFDVAALDSLLFTVDRQGSVQQHQWKEGTWHTSPVMETGVAVARARFLRGRLLATLLLSGEIELWNLQEKKSIKTLPVSADKWYMRSTPQSTLVASNQVDDIVREWEARTGNELKSWSTPGGMNAMAFTRDGRKRLTLSQRGAGMITDMDSGQQTHFSVDARQVAWAEFSPDATQVAIASEYGFVGIWNSADLTGEQIHWSARFDGLLAPHSVAFSPDGRRLVAGGQGSESIKLWDLESRQEVLSLGANGSNFFAIQFSPDGNLLAALNFQGELHLWRAPSLAEIDAAEREKSRQ